MWRDTILEEFVKGVSKLTLVADPDGLLVEEKLAFELKNKGFELLEFYDPVEFRYAYEMNYRSIWDRGENTDLVVVLRLQDVELANLPFDLLQRGRHLKFDLGSLFPNFSYKVLEKLDHKYLDDLFAAQSQTDSRQMGDNATRDFILLHVFAISAELIKTPVDLLRCLLRCHYRNLSIPIDLCERLVCVLQKNNIFEGWPIAEIVPDSEAFFSFLQERWPIYLDSLVRQTENNATKEPQPVVAYDGCDSFGFKYGGPAILPFGHQDILVYIDNLFAESMLTPIEWQGSTAGHDWAKSGLVCGKEGDTMSRLQRLLSASRDALPSDDCRYSDWLSFASKWAKLKQITETVASELIPHDKVNELGAEISLKFTNWLQQHYVSLSNLPPMSPAMVHHVPRLLARNIEDSHNTKVALIVVDGLSLSQWRSVRQVLQEQNSDENLVIRESATFAWIPTLTSVSRQAIFAGSPPFYFPSSIGSTSKEYTLWRKFWAGAGLSKLNVAFQKGMGDGDAEQALDGIDLSGRVRALGLVIDKVDKIMHGMQLGATGMHNQITQWCRQGFLNSLINYLLEQDYQVWLTSDHGNIECVGLGSPLEGSIAETRGERVRVYPTTELRASVSQQFDTGMEWSPVGLPTDYFPLVIANKSAFVPEDKKIVGHGGVSIEEVIVPLIKFERRNSEQTT